MLSLLPGGRERKGRAVLKCLSGGQLQWDAPDRVVMCGHSEECRTC
jgi:hypothetical protein